MHTCVCVCVCVSARVWQQTALGHRAMGDPQWLLSLHLVPLLGPMSLLPLLCSGDE